MLREMQPSRHPPRVGMGVTAGGSRMLRVPGSMSHQDSKQRALHCGEKWFCFSPQISVKQIISVTVSLILTLF